MILTINSHSCEWNCDFDDKQPELGLVRVKEGDRERLLVHVGVLHELEAWGNPSAPREAADLPITLLLAADIEDALAFIDDRARWSLEVKLVADLHVVHVLREPSTVREPCYVYPKSIYLIV